MKYISIHLLTFILLFGIVSCRYSINKNNKTQNNMTSITYKFGDASVPPTFHRSYTITINKDSIQLTVNSYNNILLDKTTPAPAKALNTITALVQKYKIGARESKIENDGCTGGTSKYISWTDEKEAVIFEADAYYCGGQEYGSLKGDVNDFANDLETLFLPNLQDDINSTR